MVGRVYLRIAILALFLATFASVAPVVSAQTGTVTPEQFGAAGDGVTNDTLAVWQAALTNKNILLSPGKTYLVFPGCLNINAPVLVTGTGATIKYAPMVTAHLISPVAGGITTTLQLDSTAGLCVGASISIIDPSNSGISYTVLTSPGSGYKSPPTVTVTGDGSGAQLTASIKNGQVTGVQVINPGNGYIHETTLTISGGGGSGASAIVSLPTNYDNFSRQITSISGNTVTIAHPFNSSWQSGSMVYTTGNGATLKSGATLQGLTIDGNMTNNTIGRWANAAGIVTTSDGNNIKGVTLQNLPSEGIVVYGTGNTIAQCSFNNISGNGVHFSYANNSYLRDCRFTSTNRRFSVGHCGGAIIWSLSIVGTYISHCYVEDTPLAGFGYIQNTMNDNIYATDCTVKNAAAWGIWAVSFNNSSNAAWPMNLNFTNCSFFNCGPIQFISTATGSPLPYLQSIQLTNCTLSHTSVQCSQCQNVTLTSNRFGFAGDQTSTALELDGCLNATIQRNVFVGAGVQLLFGTQAASDAITVSGNRFEAPFAHAIAWTSGGVGPDGALITGNSLFQSPARSPGASLLQVTPPFGTITILGNRLTVRTTP
jgi:hypothetical protein